MTLWFKFGFFMKCAGLLYAFMGFCFVGTKSALIAKPAQLIGLISCMGGLALIIWGSIIRWNHTGNACSGEYYDGSGHPAPYMWKSGKFMKVYLIIMFVMIGLGCLCGCCLCCVIAGAAASN